MIRPNRKGIEQISTEHASKHPPKPIDRPYMDTTYLQYMGNQLVNCLSNNGKVLSISGDVGIGKTIYCRYLVDEINNNKKRDYFKSDTNAFAIFCQLEPQVADSFSTFLDTIINSTNETLSVTNKIINEEFHAKLLKLIKQIETEFQKLQKPEENSIIEVIRRTEPSFPQKKAKTLSKRLINEFIKPLPIDRGRFNIESRSLFKKLIRGITKEVDHFFVFVDEWQFAYGKNLEDDFSHIYYDRIRDIRSNSSAILIQNPIYAETENRGSKTRLLAREGGHIEISNFSANDVKNLCSKYLLLFDEKDPKDMLLVKDIAYILRNASRGNARIITRLFSPSLMRKKELTPKIVLEELSKVDVPSSYEDIKEWIPLNSYEILEKRAKDILREEYDESVITSLLIGDFKSAKDVATLTGEKELSVQLKIKNLSSILEENDEGFRAKINYGERSTAYIPGSTIDDKLEDVKLLILALRDRDPIELNEKIIKGFIELGGFKIE